VVRARVRCVTPSTSTAATVPVVGAVSVYMP
jgi:hypothetical protein